MVKNEADIIRMTVLHQLAQGLDAVLVADNCSEDGTLDIVLDLSRDLPVYVARDTWLAYEQSVKTTLLADMARRAGAEWIVPFDADEFWFAPGGTVADYLRKVRTAVVQARMHNLFPLGEVRTGLATETTFRLDTVSCAKEKVAFRSHPMASVAIGNHDVHRAGRRGEGLRIAHLPWRSLAQVKQKVLQGNAAVLAAQLSKGIGIHWRAMAALSEDSIAELWDRITAGSPAEQVYWSPVGPFLLAAPLTWQTWDPEGLLPVDQPRIAPATAAGWRSKPSEGN